MVEIILVLADNYLPFLYVYYVDCMRKMPETDCFYNTIHTSWENVIRVYEERIERDIILDKNKKCFVL